MGTAAARPEGDERPMTVTEMAIEQRRGQVRQLLARRLTQPQMAQALGVGVDTIARDVKAVKGEMRAAMATTSIIEVAGDVLRRSETRDRELWLLYTRAQPTAGRRATATEPAVEASKGDPMVALAALRELRANQNDEVRVLQSLGVVYKAPERMAIDMKVMNQLEGLSPEVLGALANASGDEFQRLLSGALGENGAAEVLGLPAPRVALAHVETVDAEVIEITQPVTETTI